MPSRYPRTCKGKAGPHVINGPEDERPDGRCLKCSRASVARNNKTDKGRARTVRYKATAKGGAMQRAAETRYLRSDKAFLVRQRATRRRRELRIAERIDQLERGLV